MAHFYGSRAMLCSVCDVCVIAGDEALRTCMALLLKTMYGIQDASHVLAATLHKEIGWNDVERPGTSIFILQDHVVTKP